MGLFGSIGHAFGSFGNDVVHLGDDAASGTRTLAHEAAHVIQQRAGQAVRGAEEVGDDVSDGAASGLESIGVPDGIAEGVGVAAEVGADAALAG